MTGKQRRVVDDGTMFWVVDDLHGDKLGAEWQDIELCTGGHVLSHHVRNGLTLHAPAGEFENWNAILVCFSCCRTKESSNSSTALLPKLQNVLYDDVLYDHPINVHHGHHQNGPTAQFYFLQCGKSKYRRVIVLMYR